MQQQQLLLLRLLSAIPMKPRGDESCLPWSSVRVLLCRIYICAAGFAATIFSGDTMSSWPSCRTVLRWATAVVCYIHRDTTLDWRWKAQHILISGGNRVYFSCDRNLYCCGRLGSLVVPRRRRWSSGLLLSHTTKFDVPNLCMRRNFQRSITIVIIFNVASRPVLFLELWSCLVPPWARVFEAPQLAGDRRHQSA